MKNNKRIIRLVTRSMSKSTNFISGFSIAVRTSIKCFFLNQYFVIYYIRMETSIFGSREECITLMHYQKQKFLLASR